MKYRIKEWNFWIHFSVFEIKKLKVFISFLYDYFIRKVKFILQSSKVNTPFIHSNEKSTLLHIK